MKKRRRTIAIIILLCCILLSGCWDKIEIEDRLFVLGLGIDTTPGSDSLTFSFVSPIPSSLTKDQGPTFETYKAVSTTVDSALNQLMDRFSKQQFFGHAKVVILGEGILKDQKLFKEVIDSLDRSHEFYRSMLAFVVEGRAEEVFKITPKFEKLLAPYITGIADHSTYDSDITKSSIGDFSTELLNQNGNATIPRLAPDKDEVKISGIGLIKSYNLIDYLNEDESSVFNWLTGKVTGGILNFEQDSIPITYRHYSFNRKIKLDKVENGKIYLSYNIETEGGLEEYILGKELMTSDTIKAMEQSIQKIIEERSKMLIEKFQQQYKVDLIGAEDYLSKYHPVVYKSIEKDLETAFSDKIVINVKAIAKIRRTGMSR